MDNCDRVSDVHSDCESVEKLQNVGTRKRKSYRRESDFMKKLRLSSHEQVPIVTANA